MSVITVTPGDWLPESARRRLSGLRVVWTPPRAVRRYCAKARRVSPSEWSPKYRWVSDSSRPGQWRNDTNPYQVGIMDAIGTPGVERVSVIKVPQIGATECVHNCVGWKVDTDPAPVLYVYPDDAQCTKNSKKRIQAMFKDSKHLQRHLTGRDEDLTGKMIQLKPTTIYLASAQSPSQLANTPVCWVVFDEVDKYQDLVGSETSAIKLGEKRATTYPDDRKYIYLSSPTSERGPIWQQVRSAQVCMHYWVPCPHCGHSQAMSFSRIRWEGGSHADPNEIKGSNLAWYECPQCGSAWDDYDREQALAKGVWRADSGGWDVFADLDAKAARSGLFGKTLAEVLRDHLPHNISFHVPAWISTFISMGTIAAAFIETVQKEDPVEKIAALRDFANGYEGVPWRENTQARPESGILALRDERPRGLVPGGGVVACLIGSVDTQDNGFFYEIRAQGYGWEQESWCVREGFLPADWRHVDIADLPGRQWPYHPAFDPLRAVLWENEYRDADGLLYPVQMTLIDAMGHHAAAVYDFCRVHREQCVPCKGERRMATATSWTPLETYPGTARKIPGGLQLLRHNTTHFKNLLSSRLAIDPADPGAWRYHAELDGSWARMMTAEFKNEKTGYWECPSGRANHGWDCAELHLVAADILRVKMWPRPTECRAHAPIAKKHKSKRPDRW